MPEPPADVAIGAADSDDVDALVDRWVELARDQRRHGSHLLPAANRTAVRETMVEHVVTDTVRVARWDGDVVGFVSFGQEAEHYRQDTARGIVHNVYVAADYRGEGVGSALLAAAEDALADRGVDAVALQVMAANDDARAFYRSRGYDPHRVELELPVESDTLTTDDR